MAHANVSDVKQEHKEIDKETRAGTTAIYNNNKRVEEIRECFTDRTLPAKVLDFIFSGPDNDQESPIEIALKENKAKKQKEAEAAKIALSEKYKSQD